MGGFPEPPDCQQPTRKGRLRQSDTLGAESPSGADAPDREPTGGTPATRLPSSFKPNSRRSKSITPAPPRNQRRTSTQMGYSDEMDDIRRERKMTAQHQFNQQPNLSNPTEPKTACTSQCQPVCKCILETPAEQMVFQDLYTDLYIYGEAR